MKKLIALSILSVLAVAPLLALAQGGVVEVPTKYKSFNDLLPVINTITNYIFTGLIVFAVIMVIIAGFSFLTAAGDPVKAGAARSQLIYALVAIAVGALAKGLVYMIATLMGVSI